MSGLKERSHVIVGAGVAGLAAAVALAWRGARPIVIERANRIDAVGAGIQLSPNAMRAAERLGIADQLLRRGTRPEALDIHNGRTGRRVVTMPMGAQIESRYGAPSVVVHRADLIGALLRTAEALGVDIRTGLTLVDVATNARGATALAENPFGRVEAWGDLLIGADGVWSGLRTRVFNAPAAPVTPYTAWRTIVPAEHVPQVDTSIIGLWIGPGAHIVHYPLNGGTRINIVAVMTERLRTQTWSGPGDPAVPRLRFRDWSVPVRRLISSASQWTRWPLAVADPVTPWTFRDSIVLIGDAAHAGLPFAAQGAVLALEDAVDLVALLERHADDQPRALKRFVDMRQQRAQLVLRKAENNGRNYHLAEPMSHARDLVLRAIGGSRLLEMQSKIYSWQPLPF